MEIPQTDMLIFKKGILFGLFLLVLSLPLCGVDKLLDFELINQIKQWAAENWYEKSEDLGDYFAHANGDIHIYVSNEDSEYLLYCKVYAYTSMYQIQYDFVIDKQNIARGYSQRFDYEEPYSIENWQEQEKIFFVVNIGNKPQNTTEKIVKVAYGIYLAE